MFDAGPFPQTTLAPQLPNPELFHLHRHPVPVPVLPTQHPAMPPALHSPTMQSPPTMFPKYSPSPALGDSNAATSAGLGSAMGTQEPTLVLVSLHAPMGQHPMGAVRATRSPMWDLPAAPTFLLKAPKSFGTQQQPGRNPLRGTGPAPCEGGWGTPLSTAPGGLWEGKLGFLAPADGPSTSLCSGRAGGTRQQWWQLPHQQHVGWEVGGSGTSWIPLP